MHCCSPPHVSPPHYLKHLTQYTQVAKQPYPYQARMAASTLHELTPNSLHTPPTQTSPLTRSGRSTAGSKRCTVKPACKHTLKPVQRSTRCGVNALQHTRNCQAWILLANDSALVRARPLHCRTRIVSVQLTNHPSRRTAGGIPHTHACSCSQTYLFN
jgi:hypothetical protein